ncbi:MAG: right-handed parallel beta-helix repeat-containing protein [Myxococcota bacterium]
MLLLFACVQMPGNDDAETPGPTDAGFRDAAPTDAGPTDTGAPTDTGPTDTGAPTDAGAMDTGAPTDAGAMDTGAPDAGEGAPCTRVLTPADGYAPIESAGAGDVVCLSAGTYQFRVWLRGNGRADAPITIRAQDPAVRPVFDYTSATHDVAGWPGSYQSGDAYRSAWRIEGAYYVLDGIIIQGANNASNQWQINDNTAGLRYLNSTGLTVRNCRLYNNDMGIQGGGSNTLVEATEFDRNGVPNSDQSHNIYILGGDSFELRDSYAHDSVGGQNFHVRARRAVLAYNWFENAGDYEGDMMTEGTTYDPGNTGTQDLILLGNVFVQNPNPGNGTKFITMYNDGGGPNPTFNLRALWNTFVVRDAGGGNAQGIIQFSRSTLAGGQVEFSNNIVTDVRSAVLLGTGAGVAHVFGASNLVAPGSTATGLTASIFASDPGFVDALGGDYALSASSPGARAADVTVMPAPRYRFFARPMPGASLRGAVGARASSAAVGAE